MLLASREEPVLLRQSLQSESDQILAIASLVEEGGGARTVNFCQQCYNERLVQQAEPRLSSWQWRTEVERKAHRGRIWRIMGGEQFTRGMWLSKGQRRRGFGKMPRGRSKKESKVSGSRNLHSGRSWSGSEEMKTWDAAQKSCGKAISQ